MQSCLRYSVGGLAALLLIIVTAHGQSASNSSVSAPAVGDVPKLETAKSSDAFSRRFDISYDYFSIKQEAGVLESLKRTYPQANYGSSKQTADFQGVGLSWGPERATGFGLSSVSWDFGYRWSDETMRFPNSVRTTGQNYIDIVDADRRETYIRIRAGRATTGIASYLALGLHFIKNEQKATYYNVLSPQDRLPITNLSGTGSAKLVSFGIGLAPTKSLGERTHLAFKGEAMGLGGYADGLLRSSGNVESNQSASGLDDDELSYGFDASATVRLTHLFTPKFGFAIEGGYRWRELFDVQGQSFGQEYGAYGRAVMIFKY